MHHTFWINVSAYISLGSFLIADDLERNVYGLFEHGNSLFLECVIEKIRLKIA